jgi:hypothetical protein
MDETLWHMSEKGREYEEKDQTEKQEPKSCTVVECKYFPKVFFATALRGKDKFTCIS